MPTSKKIELSDYIHPSYNLFDGTIVAKEPLMKQNVILDSAHN